jgi:hypothetical protein
MTLGHSLIPEATDRAVPATPPYDGIAGRLDEGESAMLSKKAAKAPRGGATGGNKTDAERAGTWCRSFRRKSGAVGALRVQGF